MYRGDMRDELERFVASLRIPADRKTVVLAELIDHVESARAEGREPELDLDHMRRLLEAVEPAFAVSRAAALGRGIGAGLVIAVALDLGVNSACGAMFAGVVGALVALALAALAAPPRLLDLLRFELRAPRIAGRFARSVPIGPAIAYLYAVMATPFVVWIGMIAWRAPAAYVTPPSAFAVMAAVYLLLLVEGLRARRVTS
jgi:hypothetical protein